MKRQLASTLMLALLALVSFNAWASDGDIQFVAQVVGTGGGHTGDECGFWKIVYNNSGANGKSPWGVCVPPTIKVYGLLKGASAGGLTGAEYAASFGPDGAADPGYFFLEIPNPAAGVVIGQAFFPPDPVPAALPRGQNIGFAACMDGAGTGRVLLSTVIAFYTTPCNSTTLPPEIHLGTRGHFDPANPLFRCPLFTLCDAPAYTKVCLGDDITLCPAPIIPGCGNPGRPPCPVIAQCSTSGHFAINDPLSPGVGHCKPGPGKTAASDALATPETWSNVKALYR